MGDENILGPAHLLRQNAYTLIITVILADQVTAVCPKDVAHVSGCLLDIIPVAGREHLLNVRRTVKRDASAIFLYPDTAPGQFRLVELKRVHAGFR